MSNISIHEIQWMNLNSKVHMVHCRITPHLTLLRSTLVAIVEWLIKKGLSRECMYHVYGNGKQKEINPWHSIQNQYFILNSQDIYSLSPTH